MMSRFEIDGRVSRMSVDISASPSTSMQCVESSSPIATSIKSLYSKLISSCQRSEHLSAVLTPEKKATMNRITSPFIKGRSPFNPFNQNLRERLENPIFSPNVFSTVISPSQDSNEFKWTIDDLSKINPASIEEEFHFEEQVDEQTETEMQKTIDRYFTKTHKVPSPWDCKLPTSWNSFTEVFRKENPNILSNEQVNPTVSSSPYPCSVSRVDFVSRTPSQNASTQTSLSLPPDLPENITSLLRPYFSEISSDDINLSMNNSLRRKLFFQKEDESLSPMNFFRMKDVSPSVNSFPSTPAIGLRTDGSPLENFSPLDISPIDRVGGKGVGVKAACNSIRSDVQTDRLQGSNEENNLVSVKENIDPTNVNRDYQTYEACFKVFDSPKISSGIRRTRKRRRSSSRLMDVSTSYPNSFEESNPRRPSGPKFCVCDEETRMSVDNYSENSADSQDTGYGSISSSKVTFGSISSSKVNFEKLSTKNDSDLRLVTFNSWMNKLKDKTNVIIASTPTKT